MAVLFHYLHMRKRVGAACDNDYTDRRVDEYNGGNCNNCFAPVKIEKLCSLCVYSGGRAHKVTN